jgi:hypothetical protein
LPINPASVELLQLALVSGLLEEVRELLRRHPDRADERLGVGRVAADGERCLEEVVFEQGQLRADGGEPLGRLLGQGARGVRGDTERGGDVLDVRRHQDQRVAVAGVGDAERLEDLVLVGGLEALDLLQDLEEQRQSLALVDVLLHLLDGLADERGERLALVVGEGDVRAHVVEQTRKCPARCVRLQPQRGDGRREGEDVVGGEAGGRARGGEPLGDLDDGRLSRGPVVAEVDQGVGELLELLAREVEDGAELAERLGSLVGREVRGDAELGDDLGERRDVTGLDAEGARGLTDPGEVRGCHRDDGRHVAELALQILER